MHTVLMRSKSVCVPELMTYVRKRVSVRDSAKSLAGGEKLEATEQGYCCHTACEAIVYRTCLGPFGSHS